MKLVNLYEAKTHLSRIVDEAVAGESIVLARAGKPLVKLVPVRDWKPSDAFGMDRGLFALPSDFDETPDDFSDYI
ncbi:MAG: type II toxin-antitoxin system prevent-host-death family antitoxin [Candidatus Cybelea sp.]